MKKFRLLITSLSFFAVASQSLASTEKQFNAVFNPEIFSLSKKKENAFDAASATYVLSSEDMRRAGVTSIPEALRLVPGVQVSRMGGSSWAIAIRGFNRQFSNKLLVMIDGRTVYTPLFSGTFWDLHDYVLEDIDKIEVVRGPGGTIWGANAVNGIINIITKSAVETQGFYASQIIGNEDRSITEVRYGGKTNSDDSYRVYAKKSVRDGLDQYDSKNKNRDGYRMETAGFRYDMSSIKDNTISVHGDIARGTANNFFNTIKNPEQNDKDSNTGNLVVNWDRKLSKKSNFTLQTYLDYDKFDIPILSRSATTLDVDFQHFYNFSRDNQFIWGLGYRHIADKIKENPVSANKYVLSYEPDKRNDELFTLFLQDKIGLIADELYLTLGSKFEHNDFTGFEYQPNARLSYYPARNQTIWASVSRAVRTPTRGEDDIDLRDATGSVTVNRGSDTYESENLVAYELGYRIKPTHKTLIDATAFYNDYSKLRTFELQNGAPTAANLGYGESYGFEVNGKWQVTNDWRLEASYEFFKMDLHISDASNEDEFANVNGRTDRLEGAEDQAPQNQVKFRSFYNITPKVEFDNVIYYVSKLNSGNASGSTKIGDRGEDLPSYVRFDTRVGYLPSRNLELSVGVQNLFDQRHTEFKKSAYNIRTEIGRNIYVKAVWQY